MDALDEAEWDRQLVLYFKAKEAIEAAIQRCYPIIWGSCHVTLQNQLRADPDFIKMVKDGNHEAGELYRIIDTICNGTGKEVEWV